MLRLAIALVLLSIASLSLAAAPTSQPVKPKPDEKQIIDKTFGYSFNVPKLWKQVEQKPDKSAYVFHIPAPGGTNKAVSSLIFVADPRPEKPALEKLADGTRENILKRAKDAKIEYDQPIQRFGVDAWEFVYTMKIPVKITTTSGKKEVEENDDIPARVRTIVFWHAGASYQIVLTSDEAGYPARMKAADKVLATFVLGQEK